MNDMHGKTFDCARARALLSPLLDGELEVQLAAEVEEHLTACPDCRRERDALAVLSLRLRQAVSSPPPPPRFSDLAAASMEPSRPSPRWPARRLLEVAAIFVAGILIGVAAGPLVITPRAAPAVAAGPPREEPLIDAAEQDAASPIEIALETALPRSRGRKNADTRETRVEEIPVELAALRTGFKPMVPLELPGGFLLKRCDLVTTLRCRALRLRYQRGDEIIELVQQPASVPVDPRHVDLRHCTLSGRRCLRSMGQDKEIVQLAHGDVNLLVVAPRASNMDSVVSAVLQAGDSL